ncbi:MAG: T9SS type A sorting domain-containing protein, partial [Bacteroidota bacterium]
DGTLDTSFSPELGSNPQLYDIVLQPDGQIVVSGFLSQGNKKLILLRNDGSLMEDLTVPVSNFNSFLSMIANESNLLVTTGSKLLRLQALQKQFISFDSIPDKLVQDPSFNINAVASSGLPVTYEVVSGPATIEGNLVTLTGEPGLVTIQAWQKGNEQYALSAPVLRQFRVEQVLALEAKEDQQIIIYPNPSSDYILVKIPFTLMSDPQISLRTSTGQKVPVSVHSSAAGLRIDIRQATKGIHLLKFILNNKEVHSKVIIN